jgi:hypothetical protein
MIAAFGPYVILPVICQNYDSTLKFMSCSNKRKNKQTWFVRTFRKLFFVSWIFGTDTFLHWQRRYIVDSPSRAMSFFFRSRSLVLCGLCFVSMQPCTFAVCNPIYRGLGVVAGILDDALCSKHCITLRSRDFLSEPNFLKSATLM